MSPTDYNKIMQTLREVKPVPPKPYELTRQIMSQVQIHKSKRSVREVNFDPKKLFFIGLRTALSLAAAFLVGLFIYQQWEIMSKVSKLEAQIQRQSVVSELQRAENIRIEKFSQHFEPEAKVIRTSSSNANNASEMTMVDRKSLNYIIQSIRELENENQSLREQIKERLAKQKSKIVNL